jgi:glutamate carboxypeptidase
MDFYYYFKSNQGKMINLLKEIVSLESPSGDQKAVNACASFVIKEFKKAGAKITRFPQDEIGDLYLAEIPSSAPKKEEEQILLLTHIDTVWKMGKIEKMPFYISGDKAFGPGVLDMKASLVMAIYSLKALNELNIRPGKRIAIFINSAEEIGHKASNKTIRELSKKSAYALCLEPSLPGGALKIQRKGRLVIRLEAKGKAAHAGAPEKGINAIEELMVQLNYIQKIKTKETTVNIGLIGGGEKPNIVAEEAWAILDMRFWNTFKKEEIIQFLKQMKTEQKGAQVKYTVESYTPPMEHTSASAGLLSKVKEIASSMNMEIATGKSGGGSDASIASSLGIPTLDGLGPDGEGIHAENEYLILSSLIKRTALLTELLIQL